MTKVRPIRIEGEVAFVPLTKGYTAVIDAADVILVEGCNWSAKTSVRSDGQPGAIHAVRNDHGRSVYLHRQILGEPAGVLVDHEDCNGLNCRRYNLRPATKTENNRNICTTAANSSGFKGVFWDTERGKWCAKIKVNRKPNYLGRYDDKNMAAAAYAEASARLHGAFGRPS